MDDGQWSMVNRQWSEARYEITYRDSTKLFKQTNRPRQQRHLLGRRDGNDETALEPARREEVTAETVRETGHDGQDQLRRSAWKRGAKSDVNYSEGVSISSIYNHDEMTRIEPVRYPDGSSLMRFLAAPLIDKDFSIPRRILRFLWWALTHPIDFAKALFLPGWAHNVTILLVMQHADNRMRFKIGKSIFTLFRTGMVAEEEPGYTINAQVEGSHEITREFAKRTNGVPLGSIGENLLNLPTTAHILGGAPIGRNADEGVIDENFSVHNYEGMYIIDGSVMPANPGVNPSLTITALAEYAMSKIPDKNSPQ
jgi:cholesterol oxidase